MILELLNKGLGKIVYVRNYREQEGERKKGTIVTVNKLSVLWLKHFYKFEIISKCDFLKIVFSIRVRIYTLSALQVLGSLLCLFCCCCTFLSPKQPNPKKWFFFISVYFRANKT